MKPTHGSTAALAALLAALAAPAVAHAQDADTTKAREHYKTAGDLYNQGKYTQAIDHLKQAYAIKPAPAVLRQIGHCYKALGDADNALTSYKQYLEDAPDAADRPDIEKAIKELEDIKKEQEGEGVAPVPVGGGEGAPGEGEGAAPGGAEGEENPLEEALEQRRRERRASEEEGEEEEDTGPKPYRWLKWTFLGAGGVAVILSFVFRSKASGAASKLEDLACSDAERKTDPESCRYSAEAFAAEQDIGKYNKLFGITLGVGLASLAAGGLFFYLDHRANVNKEVEAEEASLRLVPVAVPGGGAFFGEVRF